MSLARNILKFSVPAALAVLSFLPSSGFAFGPCSAAMPKEISYYPRVRVCGGSAGIVLNGSLLNSFSVVVRACDNGDRDPCYKSLNACATNASSPFKVQKVVDAIIRRDGDQVPAKIHCLKERGDSRVYKMVRRMTIKRVNPVRNPLTDVLKICLPSRTRARNKIELVSTGRVTLAGNTGFNQACLTQKYLGCNLDLALQRVCPIK